MITLTKEQLSEVMCKHAEKENGVNDLLEIMLESLMVAERGEFLQEQADRNKGNGYRLVHTYGHGRKLEFRIPRDRFGNFHPKILAILKDQEEESERLAGSLYTKGLTQSQVGQVFDEIYGEHYSKTSISRMIEYVRRDVSEWLERGLDEYYPIVFVDCVHPDNYETTKPTKGVTWGPINVGSEWETRCTKAGWIALEKEGCVFLPVTGYRSGASVLQTGYGYYRGNSSDGRGFYFMSGNEPKYDKADKAQGYAVRLVHDTN